MLVLNIAALAVAAAGLHFSAMAAATALVSWKTGVSPFVASERMRGHWWKLGLVSIVLWLSALGVGGPEGFAVDVASWGVGVGVLFFLKRRSESFKELSLAELVWYLLGCAIGVALIDTFLGFLW